MLHFTIQNTKNTYKRIKKKVVLFQQGKDCLCVLLFMFFYLSLSHTYMCIFLYLYVCIYTYTKINKNLPATGPCLCWVSSRQKPAWFLSHSRDQVVQLNTTKKTPLTPVVLSCTLSALAGVDRSCFVFVCVCPFLLPKLFTLNIKT